MADEFINIAEAKKHFSELIGKVAYAKKRLVITKRGRLMARLVPVEEPVHHLCEASGWLEENDPFFEAIETIVADRAKHRPRVLSDRENR